MLTFKPGTTKTEIEIWGDLNEPIRVCVVPVALNSVCCHKP